MKATSESRAAGALLVVSAFAIGQAVQVNNGNLDPTALAWLTVGLVGLCLAMAGKGGMSPLSGVPLVWVVGAALVIQWGQLLTWGVKWCAPAGAPVWWYVVAMGICAIGIGVLVRWWRMGLAMVIAGHLLAGAYCIQVIPNPAGDVWYFQQESTAALLRGENPYGVRYRNIYDADTSFYGAGAVADGWVTYSYPYPPLMAMVTAVGRVFGDVRWTELVALELAAVLIALVAGERGAWAAALMLLMPRSLFVVTKGWTEPMVILAAAGMLWSAVRWPRRWWVAVGLMLAMKQYCVLLLPVMAMMGDAKGRWWRVGKACALAAVISAPLALWDVHSFWRSVVLFQLRQPFRIDALSYLAMLKKVSGVELSSGIGFVAAGLVAVWCWRRAERSPGDLAMAASLMLLAFFAFNKQAFANYYMLVGALTAFAAALTLPAAEIAVEATPQVERRLAA